MIPLDGAPDRLGVLETPGECSFPSANLGRDEPPVRNEVLGSWRILIVNVLGLVPTFARSWLPPGGYSYSFGIEQMARTGTLTSADQLIALVKGVLHARIGPADGVASGIAFRAARQGDFDRLPAICAAMSSNRVPVSMRLASLQMGQHLWGISRGWQWAAGMHQQLDGEDIAAQR